VNSLRGVQKKNVCLSVATVHYVDHALPVSVVECKLVTNKQQVCNHVMKRVLCL